MKEIIRRRWTPDEIKTIEKYYGKLSIDELASEKLPGRSKMSIYMKLRELEKFGRIKEAKISGWSEKDLSKARSIIAEFVGTYDELIDKLSENFPERTRNAVKGMVYGKMGITKSRNIHGKRVWTGNGKDIFRTKKKLNLATILVGEEEDLLKVREDIKEFAEDHNCNVRCVYISMKKIMLSTKEGER